VKFNHDNLRGTAPMSAPTDHEGASPREIFLEACRRNNTELLEEVIATAGKSRRKDQTAAAAVAELMNTAVDGVGNHGLHLAATNGACEYFELLSF
jgi:hypothetical protein